MPIKIEGYLYERDDANFLEALRVAYENKERPLCSCTAEGVPMYIARTTNDRYTLKRMPNSGNQHHPECDSYEFPCELSGRGELERNAITEDVETGISNVKLDFALAKYGSKKQPIIGEPVEKSEVKSDPKKMSIRSLLHCLWENASLNKWMPAMEGKRNWAALRKYLYRAARSLSAKGSPIFDILLIPETFFIDRKDELYIKRMNYLSRFKKAGNKTPLGILVGEVSKIEEARFGYKMKVKHMPDMPVFMGDDVMKRVAKLFEREISFFKEHEDIHLLTICTFTLSASGNPQVDTISMVTVDRNWIPFETLEEKIFLESLYKDSISFVKGLRYNLDKDAVIASVLLTTAEPEAIYLTPSGASSEYYEKLKITLEESEINHRVIDYNASEEPI